MISTSQKEHLTYMLILQCMTILGIGVLTWVYILPGLDTIKTNEASAREAINKYNNVNRSGISFENLGSKLVELKGKEELLKIIRSAPDKTRQELAKPNTETSDYITWLNRALRNSEEDRRRLSQAKQKINSILPTMSPISASVDEEFITLKGYVRFIEKNFLEKFKIQSNMSLGIQGVSYGQIPEAPNIGTFDLRLDFRATNTDIANMITYINNSGNPEILTRTGILTEDSIPKILSNPLMTIEALSLENVLDTANRATALNTGRITIRFYVRGGSAEDVAFLREAIINRKNTLESELKKAIDECRSQGAICTSKTRLENFELRFREFNRSIDSSRGIETSDITILGQTATSMRVLSEEFAEIAKQRL